MTKLEGMSVKEILDEVNFYMPYDYLYDFWKELPTDSNNPKRESARDLLEEMDNNVTLLQKPALLRIFLLQHEQEIDKVKFVISIIQSYKDMINRSQQEKKPEKDIEEYKTGLAKARSLLKGIDEVFIYHNWNENTGKIESLSIIDTKSEFEGRPRTVKKKNIERLKEIEEEENLGNIIQAIDVKDVENVISNESNIGAEIRFMIEYNTLVNESGGDYETIQNHIHQKGIDSIASKVPRESFMKEMISTLRMYIEEMDIDKMLLCSAKRYVAAMEECRISEEHAGEVKRRLEFIKEHLKKNAKLALSIDGDDPITYDKKEIEQEMKRFVEIEGKTQYIPLENCKQYKSKIMQGEISLHDATMKIFEALQFSPEEVSKLLSTYPDNYIFFLKHPKFNYSKETILKDIMSGGECPNKLLELLCEKTDITPKEICSLYENGIITVGDLKSVREKTGPLISNENLFEKYKQYKEKTGEEKDESKVQLEKYALAYRNTELSGKTDEELEEIGENFVTSVGDDIEQSDLIPLYAYDVIPLKVAVDWGGENTIEQLLQNESLKPADARYLRDQGLLDENVLARLFENCKDMSYAYQVALVCATFDGQTPEEQEIRGRLAQYYHIESGLINSSGNGTGKRKNTGLIHEDTQQNIKMRDPGAKYNLLAAIDKSVKIEEGIIDGHIIFHYPNVDDGMVLIEKLHKISNNKETGTIEIKADNESATYIMSEEEFIDMKPTLIQEGKIDRTQLTQKWWITRDPNHWVPHTGVRGWEDSLKERFSINDNNLRYSQEDLAKIDELVEKSIESKQGDER